MVLWFPTKTGSLSKGVVDATSFSIAAVNFIGEQKLYGVVFNLFNRDDIGMVFVRQG